MRVALRGALAAAAASTRRATPAQPLLRALHTANSRSDEELGSDLSFPAGLSPLGAYKWLHSHGKLKQDSHQLAALQNLEHLHHSLEKLGLGNAAAAPPLPAAAPKPSGLFGALFGRGSPTSAIAAPAAASRRNTIPGVYLWGGTGCGKTMLLDIFYRCAPVAQKRRAHFHAFMLDVHARLHAIRTGGYRGDPILPLADDIAGSTWLMAFDEMQVTDVGDAMIMRRLFEALYDRGLVMVATSNRAPTDLYQNGLQRELFMPFIHLVEKHNKVHHLFSPTDYRLLATPLKAGATWLSPETLAPAASADVPARTTAHHNQTTPAPAAGAGATATSAVATVPPAVAPPAVAAAFEQQWDAMRQRAASAAGSAAAAAGGDGEETLTLTAQGRSVTVPRFLARTKTGRFSFHDLCSKPLGSADFQVLAQSLASVFISDIPHLTLSERNELRRFITLIDTLYEHRVKLVASAAASPLKIFTPTFRDPVVAPAASSASAVASSGGVGSASHSHGHGYAHHRTLTTTAPAGAASAAAAAAADALKHKYDEVFAFDRTISRLMEMSSEQYLEAEWRPNISKSGALDAAP